MRLALLLVAACSAPPAPVPVAIPVLPDVPFALLDREQRMQFMKERVVPAMAPLFRAHDAHRYAAFDCKTCHGDSRDFTLPNAALTKLAADNDPRAVAWMTNTIQPAMARLLDDRDLVCTRCHVRAID